MKSELNQDVENKYKFDIEDVVKIILKKKDLLKSRHQKYSDGNYKVIGRDG